MQGMVKQRRKLHVAFDFRTCWAVVCGLLEFFCNHVNLKPRRKYAKAAEGIFDKTDGS